MSSNLYLRQAVGLAVGSAGAAAASLAYVPAALAADTAAAASSTAPSTELEEVVVTGTRIRRVDAETASPVFVLDQSQIAQSGAVTVGDLVNRIPSIAGAAVNPSLNNGGGFGESNIELRGLDAKRTLILIDGRRVNLVGASGAVDVNQIPLNLIDHVDVLKEGAGAIYGSDAIAGVVNFVTRKNLEGFELTGDWGESTKHDAQHHNIGMMWGTNTDKFHMTAGFNYNQQDALTMGSRNWSKYALYLYSGSLFQAGSSRVPTGRATLTPAQAAAFGCSSVTRIAGAAGTALSDYRCYNSQSDAFNFQPYNLNVTPQERGALFTKVNYEINDYAQVYGNVIYNHTHSASQLAPLPFDANADQIVISKNNIYNPFGNDFGGGAAVGGVNPNYTLRMSSLADRYSNNTTDSLISDVGVKGAIGTTGWNYDANVSYNRKDQTQNTSGYLLFSALQNAVGPSFIDPVNGPTCGTVATPILNCIPANIFNLSAPSQVAALNGISAHYTNQDTYIAKVATIDANGPIFKMPAGDVLMSVGADYTDLSDNFQADTLTIAQPPLYLNCAISQEACTGNERGGYNYKEGYAEIFMPLLSDLPGVKAFNIDIGVRYSNYSLFGETTKGQFKVEYRPISDLLIRGTVAQVFRAPTVDDVYAPPSANAPTLNDPCNGYVGAATAQYPNLPAACKGVPTDGSFQEPNNQVTGLVTSNPNLKPETGLVKTFGFVYDSSLLRGFNMSVDYWDYKVDNLLTTLDPNFAIQQCATTGAAQFCNLLNRYQSGPNAGQFIVFNQPTFNLGTLNTDGIDTSLNYKLKTGSIGDFNFTIDETHLISYKSVPAPGAAPEEIAGTFNKQFGFYAKDRGTATIGWSGWDASVLATIRYIGPVKIPLTDADATGAFLGASIGSVMYYDLTASYSIKRTNTSLRAGILNLADKQPPVSGINSWNSSSVTDVLTYDTIGRRFFVGLTQKF
ncbi:MAG TPA: TonB-dependent receptor [Steroidobacteraceae bacterium]|jgi:outer membrane receptor protein involved in Fe transport